MSSEKKRDFTGPVAVQDIDAYRHLMAIYCRMPPRARVKARAAQQLVDDYAEKEREAPGIPTMLRWLTNGVKINGYPELAQSCDVVAAMVDAGTFDLRQLGMQGPNFIGLAGQALEGALRTTIWLVESDKYKEHVANNPKTHAEMVGKLTEAHKSARAEMPVGMDPEDMSEDQAFELVTGCLNAHPRLKTELLAALQDEDEDED